MELTWSRGPLTVWSVTSAEAVQMPRGQPPYGPAFWVDASPIGEAEAYRVIQRWWRPDPAVKVKTA